MGRFMEIRVTMRKTRRTAEQKFTENGYGEKKTLNHSENVKVVSIK